MPCVYARFSGTALLVPVLSPDTSKSRHEKETNMKTSFKYATTIAVAGMLALAAASPSEARNGRNAAAIGLGVGAAVAGAAIASSAAYNNGYYGYYGDPGYAYGPGYTYAPGYAYDSYAYVPAPAYGYGYSYAPSYGYGYYGNNWSRQHNTNNFSIDSQR
jgi:hypothetical protein